MRSRLRSVLTHVAAPEMRPVVSASLTIGVAAGVFAIAFGVGSVSAGGSVLQTCVMSLLVFTGASQFSAVSVVNSGGSTASALGSAMLLAARNGVYGLTMARDLDGPLRRRLVAAQLTIDESTAMATAQDDADATRAAFWITGCAVYVCWNLGTLIGALAGEAINPETFGLDAAFPAGFVAMLAPHLRTRIGRQVAILGALICLVLVPFAPIGVPILCAAAAALLGLREP
jgi:4-azaleucine resistance transporter AzlC